MSAPLRGLALLLLASACSTVAPMQTASVVAPGRFRVGGQLSGAAQCGDFTAGVLGFLGTCAADYPDGIPLPEVRLDGRYGLPAGADLGLSLQVQGQLFAPERALQTGLTADVKAEMARVEAGDVTHVLSVGLLAGAAVAGRLALPASGQVELGVPLRYGLQLRHWELVAGTHLGHRWELGPLGVVPRLQLGLSAGAYWRDPAGLALQLAYLTEPGRFRLGALQLQVGWFWDL